MSHHPSRLGGSVPRRSPAPIAVQWGPVATSATQAFPCVALWPLVRSRWLPRPLRPSCVVVEAAPGAHCTPDA
ncbi:hypothetical protein GUJ93_ZPchr0013g37581 [Zizania palustris]|uniref:Uncharacterized protein n=1 Tax=Zizania palustris TaxID=103762 RepID=A0A8J6BW05_ZIZPA|nr:hypothetical protein GUJ93_ZPchr0013g37581 [Zizania palustris]